MRATAWLQNSVADFPAESRLIGVGRTVIALAQISVLVFTPAAYLFVPLGASDIVVECSGFPRPLLAYCVAEDIDRQVVSWILVVLLIVVASGLLPRITSFVHLWVALSIHGAISLPDGGEAIAQVVTLFLVLACLNDRRLWHWQTPRPSRTESVAQGVAWAGLWGLRLQMAYVYLNSSVAKVAVGPWQEGTAMYYVTRMENFGAAGLFSDVMMWLTTFAPIAVLATWGAIVAEAGLAILLLRGRVYQVLALGLGCALHLFIILQLGIVSFGLIMMGAVICATSRGVGEVWAQVSERGALRWTATRPHQAPADQLLA